MPIELKMPALSPTMEEGTLAKWLVKEGDTVTSGTVLAEIETDKATMEFEAIDEGTVAKILIAEGTDEVKVGTVIAILAGEGETAEGAAGSAQRGRRTRDNGTAIAASPAEEAQAQQSTVAAHARPGRSPRASASNPRFQRERRWSAPRSRGAARRHG
jgi:pyruvate/2-oxoglutarate dehydrogenase complex dihydrolipoamide acyltransferase (E2) component